MWLGNFRVEINRLIVLRRRLVAFTLVVEDEAETVVGPGVVRLQAGSGAELRDRVVDRCLTQSSLPRAMWAALLPGHSATAAVKYRIASSVWGGVNCLQACAGRKRNQKSPGRRSFAPFRNFTASAALIFVN